MNCYDFDKTIYDGDSSTNFYLFCLCRHKKILRHLPAQFCAFFRHYVLNSITKTQMKEVFYRYFADIPDLDAEINLFWQKNRGKVKQFYIDEQQDSDVIISASPTFFLKPMCDALGICHLIASEVEPKTGKYIGENCHGEEKVKRFYALFPGAEIDAFYSDSHSDDPMARKAKKAYWVNKDKISDWKF